MTAEEIRVPGWPAPRGYANGRAGRGRAVHVAGQIGWDERGALAAAELVPQFAQALDNVLAVVRAAGGAPEDIASMTVFVTDIAAYRGAGKELGAVWRARLGKHFPAMALVAVSALVEPRAVVEIQATAYVGGES
ncbi:MAG TPA: RidA family protein [Kofleriaceae bacterium]|nr:RidA family protein [Kofleriaceae bacterium]